jgi:hypothetical protein
LEAGRNHLSNAGINQAYIAADNILAGAANQNPTLPFWFFCIKEFFLNITPSSAIITTFSIENYGFSHKASTLNILLKWPPM